MSGFVNVDTIAIVLCVVFLAYVLAILFPFLRRRPANAGDSDAFIWHVLMPCLDEALVIERSVRRLRAEHPRVHVWCIDDASSDDTPTILARIARHDPAVHVVTRRAPEAQQGKGAALNAAWRAVQGWCDAALPTTSRDHIVIGVVDADGRLAANAFDQIAGPSAFGDPAVGAVQVQVRMINRGLARPDANDPAPRGRFGRLLVTLQDLEFRTVIAAMQHLRHGLGSAGMGGNGQFTRLSTLDAIAHKAGTPWHGALLEDFELGLHVLLAGWRTTYCDDTWVAQEGLPRVAQLVKQRTRWAQGGMQCIRYFREVMRSRKLSTPAALEICYFLLVPWTQLIGSVVYALAAAIICRYAVTTPGGVGHWLMAGGWGLAPLVTVFGILPVAVWGFVYRLRCEPTLSRRRALLLGLAYWLYTYVMVAAVWRAFGRMVRNRHGWVKTQRVVVVAAEPDRPLRAVGAHRA